MSVGAPLEIGLRRSVLWGRIAWVAPLGAAVFVGGLHALLSGVEGGGPFSGLTWIWLFFGLVLLVAAADALRVAAMRGGALRLDPDGILDRRIMRRALPWSEIERAELRRNGGTPEFIGLWTPEADRYLRDAPLFNYFGLISLLKLLAARYRFAPINIDIRSLDIDPAAVIERVRAEVGALEERALAPAEPGD